MRAVRRGWGSVRVVPVLGMLLALFAAAMAPATAVGAVSPLYARATGQVIPAELRPLWESLGGADGLGWPIDATRPTASGTEQWYQYGRVYQNKGAEPALVSIGREAAQVRSVATNPAFAMRGQPPADAKFADREYVAKHGHYVGNGFLVAWAPKKNLLGAPISEEFTEEGATVQYFEFGRLEFAPNGGGVRVSPIGTLLHGPAAPAAEPPAGIESVGQALPNVSQSGPRYAGHWVLINLAQQRMYAYDGTKLVDSSAVSTGLPGKDTPVGSFWVQQRYRATLMAGPGYYLPDVPFTQYFGNDSMSWQEGYALHGTYWHNNFGTRQSSGCVNMRNDWAEFIWGFASVGTPVEVVAS